MNFHMKRLQLLGDLRLAGIADERVLAAIAAIPREQFVPVAKQHQSYAAGPIGLGQGQSMPPPMITALLLQALRLQGTERVLEVACGPGYHAALLNHLADSVVGVDRHPAGVAAAQARLAALGCERVTLHVEGERLGWPEGGPYDAILVSAALPHLPDALLAQLGPHGRMVVPIGSRAQQTLCLVRRDGSGWDSERIGSCALAPWSGAGGWPDRPMQEATRPWF